MCNTTHKDDGGGKKQRRKVILNIQSFLTALLTPPHSEVVCMCMSRSPGQKNSEKERGGGKKDENDELIDVRSRSGEEKLMLQMWPLTVVWAKSVHIAASA